MSRLRSHNNRRRRALQGWHDPVKCPRHGVAYRGAGWEQGPLGRLAVFKCPMAGKRCKVLYMGDNS